MRLELGALDLTGGKSYPLDGSEIPFPDLPSITALLPSYAQGDGAGSMRDALLNTMRALAVKVWADTGIELNQFVSPRYASGGMLDVWGRVLLNPRAVGESDGQYRTRLLTPIAGITPNAIKAAVLAVAARFNAKVAFQEPASDCIFAAGDDPNGQAWWGYVQPDNAILWSTDPTVQNTTDGVFVSPDRAGATFFIAMQLGAGADGVTPFALADDDVTTTDANCFLSDGTVDWGFAGFDGDPMEIQVVAEVERRRAFGISWMLIENPYLNAAV